MSAIKLDVLLATSNDDRYQPGNIVDGKPNTFFVTTGSYPQEILLGTRSGSAAHISKISITSSGVKKLRVEKCCEHQPTRFETVMECEVSSRDGSKQVEQFQLNKATAGAGIMYLKFVILSGHEEFAGIYAITAEGDEVA